MNDDPSFAEALAALAARFADRPVGHTIQFLRSTPSTNDVARAWLEAVGRSGALIVADEQTAGRGRSGRQWHAPPGSSLLVSIALRPDLPASLAWLVGAWLGVAAAEAIEAVCAPLTVRLKWPNDILIGGRKCGGILVETSLTGAGVSQAVGGLGLNVNLDTAALAPFPQATSLMREQGGGVDRVALLSALLHRLNARYPALTPAFDRAQAAARAELRGAWRARLSTLGRAIWVHEGELRWPATALDVADDGGLIVAEPDGSRRRVYSADVSIRPR